MEGNIDDIWDSIYGIFYYSSTIKKSIVSPENGSDPYPGYSADISVCCISLSLNFICWTLFVEISFIKNGDIYFIIVFKLTSICFDYNLALC
jgi:hypothetical protein